jgi:hypothetical protein
MGLAYGYFLPLFFFASVYAQVVLGYSAGKTGLYILVIFIGLPLRPSLADESSTAAAHGRRRSPGRRSVPSASTFGPTILHQLLGSQWPWIIVPGAGIGSARPALLQIGFQQVPVTPEPIAEFKPMQSRALAGVVARVHRVENAGGLAGRPITDAVLAFDALTEGLATIELRGSLPAGHQEAIWRSALDDLVRGFARPGGRASG